MIADFVCTKCRNVIEDYAPTFSQMPTEKKCEKCGFVMKRVFGRPSINGGGEVSGYEKNNADNLTLGKAIDMRQKWV